MYELVRRYGFFGALELFFHLLYTKINFPGCRLIRRPFDIRNRRFIKLGAGFTSGRGCRIEAFPKDKRQDVVISIGKNVQINDYVHISGVRHIFIGDNVLMASKIFISDLNHGDYSGESQDDPNSIVADRPLYSKDVVIEENVWIGESCSILPGTTIGKCSIIGANSVVSRSIPAFSIAVGNPARVVKSYDFSTRKWEVFKHGNANVYK
jgi:acetyltransferase-like isoleucine patch superfamily enzyme